MDLWLSLRAACFFLTPSHWGDCCWIWWSLGTRHHQHSASSSGSLLLEQEHSILDSTINCDSIFKDCLNMLEIKHFLFHTPKICVKGFVLIVRAQIFKFFWAAVEACFSSDTISLTPLERAQILCLRTCSFKILLN